MGVSLKDDLSAHLSWAMPFEGYYMNRKRQTVLLRRDLRAYEAKATKLSNFLCN